MSEMKRVKAPWPKALCGATLLLLAAFDFVCIVNSTMVPAPGHSLFHVNCPPGSHGSTWQANTVAKLAAARERAAEARMSTVSRAITAGHPPRREAISQ